MQCPQCGVEITPEAVFCHQCGARIADGAAAPAAEAAGTVPPLSKAERIRETLQSRSETGPDSETELWRGTFSPRAMFGAWVGCALLLVGALILAVWLQVTGHWPGPTMWAVLLGGATAVTLYTAVLYFYRRLGIEYRLTSQRFYHTRGILFHITDRIDIFEIEDISCRQGIVDRMLGIGTLNVTSRDQTHPLLVLRGIENAQQVASQIDDARRKEQMRRGILLENG